MLFGFQSVTLPRFSLAVAGPDSVRDGIANAVGGRKLARLVVDEISIRAGDGGVLSRGPNHSVFSCGWRVCRCRGSQAPDDRHSMRDVDERRLFDPRDDGGP